MSSSLSAALPLPPVPSCPIALAAYAARLDASHGVAFLGIPGHPGAGFVWGPIVSSPIMGDPDWWCFAGDTSEPFSTLEAVILDWALPQ